MQEDIAIAKRAMKIVIIGGMFVVLLCMINIYVMMTQITASAQLSRKIHILEESIQQLREHHPPRSDNVS